jgi:hypothetical protein
MFSFLLLFFSCYRTQASLSANTVFVSNGTVLVSTNIGLILDDPRIKKSELQAKAQEWKRVLNSGWNQHSYRHRGQKVRFEFHLQIVSDDSAADLSPNTSHHIRIVFGQKNSEGAYAAYVQQTYNPFGPHSGVFPIQISPRTLIHEAGHLLNLDDEYMGTKIGDPLKSSLYVNGVTLVPGEFGAIVQGYRNVSYGVSLGKSGVMGHHSLRVWDYYVERIVRSLLD